MTTPQHEYEALERYLQGGSKLSATYQQASSDGPSELTDARIVAAARAAVEKKSSGAPFGGYQRMLPASLAALFVITFAVILINDQLPSPHQQPAPVLSGKVTEPGQQRTLAKTDALHADAAQAQLSGAAEKPAAPPVELTCSDTRSQEPVQLSASPAPKAAETTFADLGQAAAKSRMRTETLPPVADLQEADKQARQMELAKREEKRAVKAVASAPAGITSPAPSNQADATGDVQSTVNAYTDTSLAQQKERVTEQRSASTKAEPATRTRLKATLPMHPAEDWLQEITKLLLEHQETRAKQEWRAFHEHYPEFVLDPKRHADIIRLRDSLKTENNSP